MKAKDLQALLNGGKQIFVKFTNEFSLLQLDSFADPGMVARVVSMEEDQYHSLRMKLDFSVAREHNLALQSHDWFLKCKPGEPRLLGTAIEAGVIGNDLIDTLYFDPEDEVPCEIVETESSPMGKYLREKTADPGMDKTYLQWLEDHYLFYAHVHPTPETAATMSTEDALILVEQRVYKACCIAEKFEPSRRFRGNGHHFAQRIASHAVEEFRKQWAGDKT